MLSACRKAGISDKTNYYWRKKFGGMGRPQLSKIRALERENDLNFIKVGDERYAIPDAVIFGG